MRMPFWFHVRHKPPSRALLESSKSIFCAAAALLCGKSIGTTFAMILTSYSPCARPQPGGRSLDTPGDGAGRFWPARGNAGIVPFCRHPEEGGLVRENKFPPATLELNPH